MFLVAGLVTYFLPPPIASAAVIHIANLEPYKNSRLGSYLSRYMTPPQHLFGLVEISGTLICEATGSAHLLKHSQFL